MDFGILKKCRRIYRFPRVHIRNIRNTDYKSMVEEFLTKYDTVFRFNPIFVASDDQATLELVKKRFPSVYSFSCIPTVPPGKNIHESIEAQIQRPKLEQKRKFNLDMIVDFLLLTASKAFFYSNSESGFSRSIAHLHKNPELVQQLISTPS